MGNMYMHMYIYIFDRTCNDIITDMRIDKLEIVCFTCRISSDHCTRCTSPAKLLLMSASCCNTNFGWSQI